MSDLDVQVSVRSSVRLHLPWVSCERNSSYNFVPIFLKLRRCFLHGMKMCMWFGFYPAVNFCHFSTLLTFVSFQFFADATSTSPKFDLYVSRDMTKATKWVCPQRRLRSAQPDLSSLSAWRTLGSLVSHWVHSEDYDLTGRMPRLIWVFAGRTATLLVLSCRGWFLSAYWQPYCLLATMGKYNLKASIRVQSCSMAAQENCSELQ